MCKTSQMTHMQTFQNALQVKNEHFEFVLNKVMILSLQRGV